MIIQKDRMNISKSKSASGKISNLDIALTYSFLLFKIFAVVAKTTSMVEVNAVVDKSSAIESFRLHNLGF